MKETPEQQIHRLAQFIMDNIPGEPSRSEGAVDTAIRLLEGLQILAEIYGDEIYYLILRPYR